MILPKKKRSRWIKYGSERTVIVLPWFVIKFAVWPPEWLYVLSRAVYWSICRIFKRERSAFKYEYKKIKTWSIRAVESNRLENQLSQTSLKTVTASTVFSLGGLLNIAKRAQISLDLANDEELYRFIKTVLTRLRALAAELNLWQEDDEPGEFSHCFSENNFGRLGNRIVMVDYGSPNLARLFEGDPEKFVCIFGDAQPHP